MAKTDSTTSQIMDYLVSLKLVGGTDFKSELAKILAEGMVDIGQFTKAINSAQRGIKIAQTGINKYNTDFYTKNPSGNMRGLAEESIEKYTADKERNKRELESASSAQRLIATDLQEKLVSKEIEQLNIKWELHKKIGFTVEQYNRAVLDIGQKYKLSNQEIEKIMKNTGGWLSTMGKILDRAIMTVPVWMAIRNITKFLTNTWDESIKTLVEYETALTEIRIASEATKEETQKLGIEVLELSKQYGMSATESLKAAKLFAQQGLKFSEVVEMTRATLLGAQVLGETPIAVAEALTAAIRAYSLEASDSISIIDKWMGVQRKFAVTSVDLAEATKVAAATAHAFGIEYGTFLGHITAVIEVTRKSGSQAGNALQMIYTRLLTTGKEAIQTIAKVPVFEGVGGEGTFIDTKNFRDASLVIEDLAMKWDTLSEAEKIYMATQIGSRRQAAPFIALMDKYGRAIEAQIAAYNSAGEAARAWAEKQNTVIVKTEQLRAAWRNLIATTQDTRGWKKVLDYLTMIADGLAQILDKNTIAKQNIRTTIDMAEVRIAREQSLKDLEELQVKLISLLERAPVSKKKEIQKYIDTAKEATKGETFSQSNYDRFRLEKERAIYRGENLETTDNRQIAIKEKIVELNKYINAWTNKEILAAAKLHQEWLDIEKTTESEAKKKIALSDAEKIAKEAAELKEQQKKDEEDRITATEENYKEAKLTLDYESAMLKAQGFSEREILEYKMRQYESNIDLNYSVDATADKLALVRDLNLEIANAIGEQANALKSSVKEGLMDFIEGEKTLLDLFKSTGDTIRKGLEGKAIEGFTDKLFKDTDIGNIFGKMGFNLESIFSGKGMDFGSNAAKTIGNSIRNSSEYGSKLYYNAIIDGTKAMIAGKPGGSPTAGTARWEGGGGEGGTIVYPFGPKKAVTVQPDKNVKPYGYTAGYVPDYILKRQQAQSDVGAGLGIGSASIMTGYSMYQQAGGGGQGVAAGVMGGIGALGMGIGAAQAGATAGAFWGGAAGTGAGAGMLGASWIPVVGIIAGIVGMVLMMTAKKPSTTTTQTSENKISSRIDITNKSLEIVNRNLVALRSDIRTYILPSSAYFAEKYGLEDQFSIMSRRGFQG